MYMYLLDYWCKHTVMQDIIRQNTINTHLLQRKYGEGSGSRIVT